MQFQSAMAAGRSTRGSGGEPRRWRRVSANATSAPSMAAEQEFAGLVMADARGRASRPKGRVWKDAATGRGGHGCGESLAVGRDAALSGASTSARRGCRPLGLSFISRTKYENSGGIWRHSSGARGGGKGCGKAASWKTQGQVSPPLEIPPPSGIPTTQPSAATIIPSAVFCRLKHFNPARGIECETLPVIPALDTAYGAG